MKPSVPHKLGTCFFERDPGVAIRRRATAEFIGTLLLMFAATGASITTQHSFHDNMGLGLIVGAFATSGALVGLILALGSVSGGHFNPLITGLQWLGGERDLDCTVAYVIAQFTGGAAGAVLAGGISASADTLVSQSAAIHWPLIASEFVAAAGLMSIVFGCSRSGRLETGPFAVGAWLVAAIVATPSTSYANPAIAVSAIFAGGPIGLSATTALVYATAEIAGALAAFLVISILYPRPLASDQPNGVSGAV